MIKIAEGSVKAFSKKIIIIVGVLVAIAVISQLLILWWVDKQEIPVASEAGNILRFEVAAYAILPGKCGDLCVVRTIKLAHLVALSKYGKKTLADFAKDLGAGYSLLNAALIKGDFPDQGAEFEVALERLLFFNRMSALALSLGRDLGGEGSLEKVASLEEHASDEEEKSVVRREVDLFRILQHINGGSSINHYEFSPDHASFPDTYHLLVTGLALCAVGDGQGAEYINQVLPFFKNKPRALIYAITRNLDVPLIAAAEQKTDCLNNVYELKTILVKREMGTESN